MNDKWLILDPIKVGKRVCRNKIVMAAHSYGYADETGLPTEELVYYLSERAIGGIGLVIMGSTSVSINGTIPTGNPTINIDDRIIPWYRRISSEVHKHGALIVDQLMHAGGQLRNRSGINIFAPSSIHHERTRGTPVELSVIEIQQIVQNPEHVVH
jgi:dimethylglycine catabolism A